MEDLLLMKNIFDISSNLKTEEITTESFKIKLPKKNVFKEKLSNKRDHLSSNHSYFNK